MPSADQVIATARAQIGDRYVYGAVGPDTFDCSGLMLYSFGKNGIGLPRTAAAQQDYATPISASDRRPGDLIFWGNAAHHVAL